MKRNIDTFINDLLHIDNVGSNMLLNLKSKGKDKVYYLFTDDRANNSNEMLKIIAARIGKLGNTVLRQSALVNEQMIGRGNALDWEDENGQRDPKALDNFIKDIHKELELKGNNPLFLSIGAVSWRLATSVSALNTQVSDCTTPLIIFPIRLIRSVTTRPISIEFIDDDIFINPCFIAKLREIYGDEIIKDFPHPSGDSSNLNAPIRLCDLGTGENYFDLIENYINNCRGENDTLFSFDRNTVCISKYHHDEICMYYDIQRNKEKIYESELVKRLFTISQTGENIPVCQDYKGIPAFIEDHDSAQERIIKKVLAGNSLVVKGPPGTGKTLTIVNMIASLLADGKKVMLVSKKLAALSEVYKKLPDELRDFVMLLDCETEAQAANLSPATVKRNFSTLLNACKDKKKLSETFFEDMNSEQNKRTGAIKTLSAHYQQTFDPNTLNVMGLSYYEALDTLLKNENIETIEFIDPQFARLLTRDKYNLLKNAISKAADKLKIISGADTDNEHSVLLCPWYSFTGVIPDGDTALNINESILPLIDGAEGECKSLLLGDISDIKPLHLLNIINTEPTKEDVINISRIDESRLNNIKNLLMHFVNSDMSSLKKIKIKDIDNLESDTEILNSLTLDTTLTLDEIKVLYEKSAVLKAMSSKNEASVRAIIADMDNCYAKKLEHIENMHAIFKSELNDKELAKIDKAYASLQSYVGANATAPRFMDLGAKMAYSSLKELSYLENPTFDEIVTSVDQRHSVCLMDEEIKKNTDGLCRLFRATLDLDALRAIELLVHKTEDKPTDRYIASICNDYNKINAIVKKANVASDATVNDIRSAYILSEGFMHLSCELDAIEAEYGISLKSALRTDNPYANSVARAKKLIAVNEFIKDGNTSGIEQCAELIERIVKKGSGAKEKLDALFIAFKLFGQKAFPNYYSEMQGNISFKDLEIYKQYALDRNAVAAATEYFAIRGADKDSAIALFFQPFEYSGRSLTEYSIEDVFEHSVFDLALRNIMRSMPNRNGRGQLIEKTIDQYTESERNLFEYNTKRIREICISRINANDSDFAFLNAENDTVNNLRRIFKLYSKAILKLKKCFLLSPYTVSVLFGKDDFSDFDTVIVDEASQLEPTTILPVLFRTKQCVFVGDEYQMPPISHFTARSTHTVRMGDEEHMLLPADTSLLYLATNSNNFDVEKLQCHFRSKTESLITFSQKRFYPFMRTFPACVPKKDGLGFKDIYIENGESEGGKNDREARAVITELYNHFEKYYDKITGILRESVGVVAFGESQLEHIKKYVKGDPELKGMIDKALSHFDDLPEKLIFFKTVETVQGQEIDHLILSLTYAGNGNSFGDLSRKSIGGCIFNVAVTRARSSITMIHSLKPEDTTNETVHDYLEIVERFAKDGNAQFISAENSINFINSVKNYIVNELKIPEDRVVINCGATEGSVRIPIAVLSEDGKVAKLGIFCEKPHSAENFIDANIRYYNILKNRGWKLHRIFIQDWIDNALQTKKTLADVIKSSL